MMTRAVFAAAFCLLFAFSPSWAQSISDFEKANQAISSGEDHRAQEILQKINRSEARSFGSLYNEGLAWRNLGDLPRSRAAFEQALIISPHDLATRRRLREIEGQLDPKHQWVEVRGTPWWTMSEAQFLLLFPGLVLVVLALVGKLRRQPPSSKALLACVVSGLALAALIAATAPSAHRAVVVASETQLLPEPLAEKTGERLLAGLLVDIINRQQHFAEIRTGDGKIGWVRLAQLVEIAPPEKEGSELNGNPPPEAQKDERSVPVWPATPRESPSR